MAKNFLKDGKTVTYTNASGSTIISGTVVKIGARVGVALTDIVASATGELVVIGVFSYAKSTGASTGGVQGADAYWDDTNKKFTAVSSGNTKAGYFSSACVDGDATCKVKINA